MITLVKCSLILLLLVCAHVSLLNHGEAASSIALDDCAEMCGDIPIPYPFGMAAHCYFHEPYKIVCQQNKRPVLSVGNISYEVLNITDSVVYVLFPIIKLCNKNQNLTSNLISLEGTPFFFSSLNSLIALGCNINAWLRVNGSTEAGCASVCKDYPDPGSASSIVGNTCNGDSCCQGRVPSGLKTFTVTFDDIDHNRNEFGKCTYIYLMDDYWSPFGFSPYSSLGSDMRTGYAPVALDWVLSYDAYSAILGNRITQVNQTVKCLLITNQTVKCSCNSGYEGNPYLPNGCTGINLNNRSHSKAVPIGIGGGLGGLLLAFLAWISCKKFKKLRASKQREKFFKRNGGLLLQEQLLSGESCMVKKVKMFSHKELLKATDQYNVNRMLGRGGQGTVFKGMLEDGRIVAVKKSNVVDNSSKIRDFINEILILSQINHRNVVRLLGCCLETDVPMLVYEFIPNGNLFQLLHPDDPSSTDFHLTWDMRMKIAVEVAGAIAYLHSAACIPIFHRDIKSTNILLDDKFRAKVADFGASKSIEIDKTHVTTRVQGTFGYLDPEYFRSSQFTEKSDVYSFGVVLVELITGLKSVYATESDQIRGLAHNFLLLMEEGHLFDTVDEIVKTEMGESEEIIQVANLAKRCLSLAGIDRPTMKEASMVLDGVIKSRNSATILPSLENSYSFDEKLANSSSMLKIYTTSAEYTGQSS